MSGTEGNIIIISFDFVNSNPLITANFIAHIGWITILCSSILASVEAERSSCKGLLLLLVQDSFYAPHPKWISHFPYFPFLLFKVFFFFPHLPHLFPLELKIEVEVTKCHTKSSTGIILRGGCSKACLFCEVSSLFSAHGFKAVNQPWTLRTVSWQDGTNNM